MPSSFASTSFARVALASLIVALAPGCDPDGSDDDTGGEVVEGTCTLGLTDADGNFVPLGAGADRLELILGFQGFIWVEVNVSVEPECPDLVDASTGITMEGHGSVGGAQPLVTLDPSGSGDYLSEDILLFLNGGSMSEYVGSDAELAVALEGDGWRCVTSAAGVLVDDDPCIHTGEDTDCEEEEEP